MLNTSSILNSIIDDKAQIAVVLAAERGPAAVRVEPDEERAARIVADAITIHSSHASYGINAQSLATIVAAVGGPKSCVCILKISNT
jgi:hypothetical protein